MVGKCANSSCHTSFRYLHEGKLFCVEIPPPQAGSNAFGRNFSDNCVRRVEWYWLCNRCAEQMTLKIEEGRGIVTAPLSVLDSAKACEGGENCRAGKTLAAFTDTCNPGTPTADIRKPLGASIATVAGSSLLTR